MTTPTKIKIAVRMRDRSRRLYTVDDAGLAIHEMMQLTRQQVPGAQAVLIGLPSPAPPLVLESA